MRPALLSSLLLSLLLAAPASADCFFPSPARAREVIPETGSVGVPTSVLPRVSYSSGAYFESQCGAKPPAPVLRRVVAAADAGMTLDAGVDASSADAGAGPVVPGTWAITTDDDPRAATTWQFRPDAPLAPHATYELVDAYPETCPCLPSGCQAGTPAVFATFTTGDGPDSTPPVFGGLAGNICEHEVCGIAGSTCCGPYDHLSMTFITTQDASDDNLVGLRLYARKDGESYDYGRPLAPLKISDPVDSAFASRWSLDLTPGTWHVQVRAFDSSGNEDGNTTEVTFQWPLADDVLCQRALRDLGVDDPDLSWPVMDTGVVVDAGADAGSSGGGGGCSCSVSARGGSAHGAAGAALALGAVLGLLLHRRRMRA